MATPATSAQWVITFRRDSFESQTTYSITIANTVDESSIQKLVKAIQKVGKFLDVKYGFVVVVP